MACSVTIYSNFTSHGKKENGFYSNVDKITKWQEEYNFPHGVVDLFDELNHCGIENQSESTASTIEDLVTDFNTLLSKLKTAGLMVDDTP